jgi:hypothetical protein
MITRSKARAIKQAQEEAKLRQATPTQTALPQPSSRVCRNVRLERQLDQVLTGDNDQMQLQPAEIAAALLADIANMATEENQAAAAGATINQRPIDGSLFNAAGLEHLATTRARHDLMRTSGKILWDYFRITTLACQASAIVRQIIRSIPSYFVAKQLSPWLGLWLGIFAIALLALLLHLFNVLFVRRIWTWESLAKRVAASAAVFFVVGEFLETNLEWMPTIRCYAMLISLWWR